MEVGENKVRMDKIDYELLTLINKRFITNEYFGKISLKYLNEEMEPIYDSNIIEELCGLTECATTTYEYAGYTMNLIYNLSCKTAIRSKNRSK